MAENCNDCKYEKECNHTGKYDYTYDKIMDYQSNKEYNSFKDICDLLNEQEEEIQRLKIQLQTDDVCNKCKHEYLVQQNDGYYISKCKKGFDECSKGTIKYCEDFELGDDVE